MPEAASPFSLTIKCPHCGQHGFVAWEGAGPGDPAPDTYPRLVFLSKGFHAESARTLTGDGPIVCDVCDHVQEHLVGGSRH